MSTTGQHEFHPDAEQLSAFAERALNEVERRQMMAHLAVCRRCREVIALAQQALAADEMAMEDVQLEEAAVLAVAAPVAVAAAALAPAARTSRRQRTWWRSWRVAWVPAAALAAAAGFAVYIHLARIARNAELAKNTPPALSQNETAEKTAPQEQAKELPAPPPPAGPHAAEKTPPGSAGAVAAQRTGVAAPEVTPLPSAAEAAKVEADRSALRTASAEQPIELRGAAGSPVLYKAAPAPPPAQQQLQAEMEEKKAAARGRQTETAVAMDHLYAASASPPPSGQGTKSETALETSVPAAPRSDVQEPRGNSVAALGAFRGNQAYASFVRVGIRLPSGLAAASIASASNRMLAIDTAGTVFLSEDSGASWRGVVPRWTGRAVLVRTRTIQAPSAAPAPAAKSSAPAAGAAPSVPSAAVVFELVNDKNEIWLSADGATWSAK